MNAAQAYQDAESASSGSAGGDSTLPATEAYYAPPGFHADQITPSGTAHTLIQNLQTVRGQRITAMEGKRGPASLDPLIERLSRANS
jgi:hypothetical protein